MDYKNIYYKIIEKAKKEDKNGHRQLGYYEKHHILPKSLGGSNDENNLVKLTAREHFICHWLLVKMYDKGTNERYKMLCALWRMNNKGSISHKEHYINSRAYEKLRIEFAERVSEITSIAQKGKLNSQFGTKWYTNRNTGESKKFKEKPDDTWIDGRNIFNKHELWSIQTKRPLLWRNSCYSNNMLDYKKILDNKKENTKKETIILWEKYKNGNISLPIFAKENNISYDALYMRFKTYIADFKLDNKKIKNKPTKNKPTRNKNKFVINRKEKTKLRAHQWWNLLHSGTFNNLEEFAKSINVPKMTIYNTFAKYLPIIQKIKWTKNKFKSNPDLINIFE